VLAHVLDVAAQATAVVAVTTTWKEFPALWPALLEEVYAVVRARPELAPAAGPGPVWQNVMLYKDDAPSVEVGVLVNAPFAPQGRVVPSRLPGGTVVMAVHRGDYAGLGAAHDAARALAAERGLHLPGPRWEIYGHGDDPDGPETEVSWLAGLSGRPGHGVVKRLRRPRPRGAAQRRVDRRWRVGRWAIVRGPRRCREA
jgi:effector-binding domain-containing protein